MCNEYLKIKTGLCWGAHGLDLIFTDNPYKQWEPQINNITDIVALNTMAFCTYNTGQYNVFIINYNFLFKNKWDVDFYNT